MRRKLLLLLLLLLLLPHSPAASAESEEVRVEVIVDSYPCSTTCGLGIRSQTLCFLKDGESAMEGDTASGGGREVTQVTEQCRERKVKCRESWQCGLRTVTVTEGQRVELDCLGEVMQTMGRFSWRVSWRYARGIISSDDSLFARWKAPELDRAVLDPVREENAGTYRCDVQDAAYRRVKRVYWGIRVLPSGILNLDYDHSLAQWDQPDQDDDRTRLPLILLVSVSLAAVAAGLILLGLHRAVRRKRRRMKSSSSAGPANPQHPRGCLTHSCEGGSGCLMKCVRGGG